MLFENEIIKCDSNPKEKIDAIIIEIMDDLDLIYNHVVYKDIKIVPLYVRDSESSFLITILYDVM